MGYLDTASTPEVLVVHTAKGKVWLRDAHYPKARVWLLDDRTAVVLTPDPTSTGKVRRTVEQVTVSEWDSRAKVLTAVLADDGVLRVDGRGCGCNMGAVGNAGPVDTRYRVTRVRPPEWHTVV